MRKKHCQRTARRAHRPGFTLLELVIVLTVFAVVSAIAVPTFNSVKNRAADRRTEAVLASIMRAAAATNSPTGNAVGTTAAFTTVVTTEMRGGPESPGTWSLLTDDVGTLRWSASYGEVHLAVSEDGSEFGLAMESRDRASCSFATGSGNSVTTWTVREDLQAACSARFAIGSYAGGAVTPDPLDPAGTAAPMAPDVNASSPDSATIDLAWTAVEYAEGYRVYADGASSPTATLSAATLSWSHTGLLPASTHTYEVSAFNAAGESTLGSASATTRPTAPAVSASSPDAGTVDLAWLAVDGATGYRVYTDGASSPTATLSAATLSWSHTGLLPASTHTYEVEAVNGGGAGAVGSASATTRPAAPEATLNALSSSAIRVSWSAISGASTYRVENGAGTALVTLPSGTLTWDHTGLSAGTSYTYRVYAVGVSGDSAANPVSTVTIPATPVVVSNCPMSGSTITGNCTPTWSAMTGATSYSVTSFGVSNANYTTTSTTGTTLVPSISDGTTGAVVVFVSACNTSGCSSAGLANTIGAPAPSDVSISWSNEAYGYRQATISGTYAFGYEVQFWHNGGTVYCSDTNNGALPSGAAFPVGCSDGSGTWTSRYLGYGTHNVLLHAYAQRDAGGTFGGSRTITVAGLGSAIFGSRYAVSAYGVNPYHSAGWRGYIGPVGAP